MSSEDSHHHHHKTHKVLEKISSKLSAIKDDITEAVRERKHSMSSDRRSSMSSEHSITNLDSVTFTLQDDSSSTTSETKHTVRTHGMNHAFLFLCFYSVNSIQKGKKKLTIRIDKKTTFLYSFIKSNLI